MSLDSEGLFELARTAEEPTDADLERVRSKLDVQIAGLGVLAAGKAGLATGSMAPTSVGSFSMLKLLSVLVLAAIPVGYALVRAFDQSEAPAVVVAASAPSGEASVAARRVPAEASSDTALPRPVDAPMPRVALAPSSPGGSSSAGEWRVAEPHQQRSAPLAPAPLASVPGTATAASASVPVAAPALPTATPAAASSSANAPLVDELRRIERAERQLREHDAPGALASLNAYSSAHPHGVLRQEHDALQVIALCELGSRARAEQARRTFEQVHPQSMSLPRIRAACDTRREDGDASRGAR